MVWQGACNAPTRTGGLGNTLQNAFGVVAIRLMNWLETPNGRYPEWTASFENWFSLGYRTTG
jgi:hypothetical protein